MAELAPKTHILPIFNFKKHSPFEKNSILPITHLWAEGESYVLKN